MQHLFSFHIPEPNLRICAAGWTLYLKKSTRKTNDNWQYWICPDSPKNRYKKVSIRFTTMFTKREKTNRLFIFSFTFPCVFVDTIFMPILKSALSGCCTGQKTWSFSHPNGFRFFRKVKNKLLFSKLKNCISASPTVLPMILIPDSATHCTRNWKDGTKVKSFFEMTIVLIHSSASIKVVQNFS